MINPILRGGDIIAFSGAGFLSDSIQLFTDSILSHAATVLDPAVLLDGKPQTEINLIESTVYKGHGGPQINPLAERIATYDAGGRIWALRLSDRIRAYLDWPALWACGLAHLYGHSYAYLELAEYIARKLPFVSWVPDLYREDPKREVCAEFCAELLRAGGLPGLKPAEIPPQQLAELRIYCECVQLTGEPAGIKNWNTV